MIHFFRFQAKSLFLDLIAIFLASFVLTNAVSISETEKRATKYVGSEACKECHENEYKSFMTYAKKATSYRSVERLEKKLTEEELKGCYSCHTTGYGNPGGFISVEDTPHLKNAGCEVCHGPGELHIKTRQSFHIKRKLTVEDCEVCHTEERVKAFRYKPLIHGGAH
ncbi:MAG: cytochrome C [Nitrospirae bacterium]|nr:cytochrome C [Nitrospirota bacterium]